MEFEAKVSQLVEHLFREETGKIISALTGSFGLRNLELIEDAVQEALLKALRVWSYGNIPPNPAAWLMLVAKNHALDHLRRDTRWREKEEQIALEQAHFTSTEAQLIFSEDEIKDDQLRMMFATCHPALARESQVALTLKLLCGFSMDEIAHAFLTNTETIAKRLTRARDRLKTNAVPFEIPSGPDLTPRLDAVLDALYLLFNEGYNASQGDDLIRRDLCDEAIRLTSLLAEHPAGDTPRTHALLALVLLQAARFSARINFDGEILLLQDQDRAAWDQKMIARGLIHLERAAAGEKISQFHLQAGIAACHCVAQTWDATDWKKILQLYDMLLQIDDSPVIALNRAVALGRVKGPDSCLAALERIEDQKRLSNYHLFHAVRGECYLQTGRTAEAANDFRCALSLTSIPAEQNFLQKKLREIAT